MSNSISAEKNENIDDKVPASPQAESILYEMGDVQGECSIFPNPDRSLHLKLISIPQFYHPYTQVIFAGFTNFLSVGMFNVLISLGGSGQVDATTADNANTVLYALFAALALFAGSIINRFGTRITLSLGALGYAVYGASFWVYNNVPKGNVSQRGGEAAVYIGGICCGLGAATLWVACGTVMTSYCTEKQKGRFVSIFFFLSFLGSVIGGIIPVAQNQNNTDTGSVSDGTYIAITILMIVGIFTALLVANPESIIRSDGTRVLNAQQKSFKEEISGIYYSIKKEPYFIFFLPFSFMALYYPAFQSNDFNGYFFNVRTRAVNGLLYGISQMLAAILFGLFLDLPLFKRRSRALIGWFMLFITVFIVSLCGYFPTRESHRNIPYDPPMDLHDGSKAAKYMVLYFFYGWQDGMVQAYAFWIMGALSNDSRVVSMYAAFYKVMGAIAAAIAFGIDADGASFLRMFGSYWGVSLFGVLSLGVLVFKKVQDTSEDIGKTENLVSTEPVVQ